jgi:hypothetical protein
VCTLLRQQMARLLPLLQSSDLALRASCLALLHCSIVSAVLSSSLFPKIFFRLFPALALALIRSYPFDHPLTLACA